MEGVTITSKVFMHIKQLFNLGLTYVILWNVTNHTKFNDSKHFESIKFLIYIGANKVKRTVHCSVSKQLQIPWFFLMYWKYKFLFCTIISMIITFHFIFKMLKIPILKLDEVEFLKMFLLAQNVPSYKTGYM